MQSRQPLGEKSGSFRKLSIPLCFSCLIGGGNVEVSITHEDNSRKGQALLLTFSDGHGGIFFRVEGSPFWHEEGTGPSPYALAVSDDLNALCHFDLERVPIVLPVVKASKAFNVWVQDQSGVYHVYYEGDHRFSLYEKELGWGVASVGRHYGYVDEEIQALVEHHLTTRNS